MELVMYVRDKKVREIVEEKMEVIYKSGRVEYYDVNDTDFVPAGPVDRKRLWVRLGRGKPIGVVISDLSKEKIGWSLVKYPDRFNKTEALKLARYRMNNNTDEDIPHKIIPIVNKMMKRRQKVIKSKV